MGDILNIELEFSAVSLDAEIHINSPLGSLYSIFSTQSARNMICLLVSIKYVGHRTVTLGKRYYPI
jgi:hypothetical protein